MAHGEFSSNFSLGDDVKFCPDNIELRSAFEILEENKRYGKVVAVKFTKGQVSYDILDDIKAYVFDEIPSHCVEASDIS